LRPSAVQEVRSKEVTSFTEISPEQAMISVSPSGQVYRGGVENANYQALEASAKRLSRVDKVSAQLFGGQNFARPWGRWRNTVREHGEAHKVEMEAGRALQASINRLNDKYRQSMDSDIGGALMGSIRTADVPLIQNILLYGELAGAAIQDYYLESLFKVIPVPTLDARAAERIPGQYTTPGLHKLQRARDNVMEPREVSFHLLRMATKVPTAVEDQLRTIYDIEQVQYRDAMDDMLRTRNQEALEAIKQIGNTQTEIAAFETLGGNGSGYWSAVHATKELRDLMQKHELDNKSRIKWIAMNPSLATAMNENTWTLLDAARANTEALMPGGGVASMPRIKDVRLVTDIEIPDRTIYAGDDDFLLLLGEGGKTMYKDFDPDTNAAITWVQDFHEHICTHEQVDAADRAHGFTVEVAAPG